MYIHINIHTYTYVYMLCTIIHNYICIYIYIYMCNIYIYTCGKELVVTPFHARSTGRKAATGFFSMNHNNHQLYLCKRQLLHHWAHRRRMYETELAKLIIPSETYTYDMYMNTYNQQKHCNLFWRALPWGEPRSP